MVDAANTARDDFRTAERACNDVDHDVQVIYNLQFSDWSSTKTRILHTQLVSHLTDPSLISKFHFQNLQKHLDKDYGVNEVFATLANNCFEYNDLEYTYKMCAFDYTAQKPLHGGSETRLGKYFEKG